MKPVLRLCLWLPQLKKAEREVNGEVVSWLYILVRVIRLSVYLYFYECSIAINLDSLFAIYHLLLLAPGTFAHPFPNR